MADRRRDDHRWRGRPGHARALRIAVVVAPIATSLLVAALATKVLPHAAAGPLAYARVALVVAIAMLSAAVTERLARKLLPLSVLLELSMLFPDRAPSRLAVARRARHGAISPEDLLSSRDEDAAGAAVRILALMSALAAHDRRTRGHAERVRAFTDLLALRMDLPKADRDKLRWAALLHDIGKLDISPAVLNKPSGLSSDEWTIMRRHPVEGANLAGPLMPWLGEWGKAIPEHHERYDGRGYPMGLAATDISLAGRLVGVVDAYETMTAARAYKKALATREARAELARCAGTQFDPACVRAFLAVPLPRLLWASGPLSFVVQMPFLRFIQDAGLHVASVSTSVVSTTSAIAGAAVLVIPAVAVAGAVQQPSVMSSEGQASTQRPPSAQSAKPVTPTQTPVVKLPAPTPTPSLLPTPSPSATPSKAPAPVAAPKAAAHQEAAQTPDATADAGQPTAAAATRHTDPEPTSSATSSSPVAGGHAVSGTPTPSPSATPRPSASASPSASKATPSPTRPPTPPPTLMPTAPPTPNAPTASPTPSAPSEATIGSNSDGKDRKGKDKTK